MELIQDNGQLGQDEELARQLMSTIRRLHPSDRKRIRQVLKASEPPVDDLIAALERAVPSPGHDRDIRGQGLGASVSVEDGRVALRAIEVEGPDSDWARSELLGAGAMADRLHVSAATLANWRTAGHAVAFRRDRRNYLYPVRQFRRGLPMPGIVDVLRFFGTIEDAWEWLVTPNIYSAGQPPIDRLQADHMNEVLRAAEGAIDFI